LAIGQQKTPTPIKGIEAAAPVTLFSGIFNVARNPVTNRHAPVLDLLQCSVKQSGYWTVTEP
jgi:hypothetical protein